MTCMSSFSAAVYSDEYTTGSGRSKGSKHTQARPERLPYFIIAKRYMQKRSANCPLFLIPFHKHGNGTMICEHPTALSCTIGRKKPPSSRQRLHHSKSSESYAHAVLCTERGIVTPLVDVVSSSHCRLYTCEAEQEKASSAVEAYR